ncbi:MAG: aldehyde dehydrogenase family protein, partial [Cyclobacteriaceae bacterium]|nr:aldehyde dehydrogenase family protein [Cyclobacteriaceae bacterium]
NFYTQGEICSNGTRVYVANSILHSFIDELVAKTKKLKIGDPMNPKVHVGALISAQHMDKVMQCINEGIESGAKLIYGGSRYIPEDEHIKDGYYVEPTIFLTDDNENKLVKNEIFGPVMTILGFDEEKEVIDRANDTEFGLAGGVFTKDLQRGHRVAHQLQCGVCWINNYNITPVEVPFGGYKNSGIGRENGLAAIEHYTQLKTVYVEMGKIDSPYR